MSEASSNESPPVLLTTDTPTEQEAAPATASRKRSPYSSRLAIYTAAGFIALAVVLLAVGGYIFLGHGPTVSSPAASSGVDPGTPLDGKAAPDFTLIDQFGQAHRLSDFRGKAVVLAFIDSRCTDTCPLTAETLRLALGRLGPRASQVQLLAVNANPIATKVSDVRAWSDAHQMTNRWLFLTGPANELQPIWKSYGIFTQVEANGDVTHTPAIYLIDSAGREQVLMIQDNNSQSVGAEASLLARDVAKLVS